MNQTTTSSFQKPSDLEFLPTERLYLQRLLKEHIDYYRTLAGNSAVSEATLIKLKFLEHLYAKLGYTPTQN